MSDTNKWLIIGATALSVAVAASYLYFYYKNGETERITVDRRWLPVEFSPDYPEFSEEDSDECRAAADRIWTRANRYWDQSYDDVERLFKSW